MLFRSRIVQEQAFIVDLAVVEQGVEPYSLSGTGTSNKSMNDVVLVQELFSQVGPILTSDSSEYRRGHFGIRCLGDPAWESDMQYGVMGTYMSVILRTEPSRCSQMKSTPRSHVIVRICPFRISGREIENECVGEGWRTRGQRSVSNDLTCERCVACGVSRSIQVGNLPA